MGKLYIHNPDATPESIVRERAALYLSRSSKQKLEELFALIEISRKLNNGQPLKHPQGKGIIIKRK